MAITGAKYAQIAEALHLHPDTVKDLLTDARRSETFQRARDWVGVELLPRVLANLRELLDQGDKDVTLKMAESMALIGGGARHIAPWGAPAVPTPSAEVNSLKEESFEAIRLRITRVHAPDGAASPPRGVDTPAGVIDVQASEAPGGEG
jgi:ABC-type uncharacterized transport system permease subunit